MVVMAAKRQLGGIGREKEKPESKQEDMSNSGAVKARPRYLGRYVIGICRSMGGLRIWYLPGCTPCSMLRTPSLLYFVRFRTDMRCQLNP